MDKSLGSPTDSTAAGELLAETERVRTKARRDRHGFWLPLTLFGLIVLGAMPLFVRPTLNFGDGDFADVIPYPEGADGPAGPAAYIGGWFHPNAVAIGWYWLIALPLGYLVTAAYYHLRARHVGIGGRMWPYVVSGIGLLLVAPFLFFLDVSRGTVPLVPLGIALFVLAGLERSWAMVVVATAFLGLAIAVNLYDFENVAFRLGFDMSYETAPVLDVALPGALLLVCGLGAAGAQLVRR